MLSWPRPSNLASLASWLRDQRPPVSHIGNPSCSCPSTHMASHHVPPHPHGICQPCKSKKKYLHIYVIGKNILPYVQINVICYSKFCMYEWCAKWQGCCVILIPPLNYSPDIQMLRLSKIMQDVCMKWTQLNSAIYGLTPRIPRDWWCAGNGLACFFYQAIHNKEIRHKNDPKMALIYR